MTTVSLNGPDAGETPAQPDAAPRPGLGPGLTPPSGRFEPSTFLSDVILELGVADPERVEAALQAARNPGTTLEDVLVETGVLTEDELARALAERYGVELVDLDVFEPDPHAGALLRPAVARRFEALPLAFVSDDLVLVAMADPGDWFAASQIARITEQRVRVAVAARSAVHRAIEAASEVNDTAWVDLARPSEGPGEPNPAHGTHHRLAGAPPPNGREPNGARPGEQHRPDVWPSTELAANGGAAPTGDLDQLRRWLLERWLAEREERLEAERRLIQRERAELESGAGSGHPGDLGE